MKKLIASAILLSAAVSTAVAQKKHTSLAAVDQEWDPTPVVHPAPPEYKNDPAFFVVNDLSLDYRYEGRTVNQYSQQHVIIKVLDNRGIESFNKIAIPVDHNTRVPLIKARTILPSGKVLDIAKDMIKVTKDETGRYSIIIAMEGVERNAEVELLVKEIHPGSLFGSVPFQNEIPTLSSTFTLSSPEDMQFEEKSYNNLPAATMQMVKNRRVLTVAAANIPALHHEPLSYYSRNAMRAEYRIVNFIDKNDNDTKKLYTWNDFGRMLFNKHCKITEKERAAVNKYLSELGVITNGKELANIKKIESGIKSGITLYAFTDGQNAERLDTIINKRTASAAGYVKLFYACFVQAGVKAELGMAMDRTEHTYDARFENWDNMDQYLFYFPNTDKFMSPTARFSRYPFVPDELLTSKGVFCIIPANGITIGGLTEIKTIKPLAANESLQKMTANVSFSDKMDAMVDVSYSYTGYPAADLRTELALQRKDRIKDWVTKLLPLSEKPEDINKYTILNEGFDKDYDNKPLEISASLNTPQLVETAGPKLLFKLGEMMGSRGELYVKKDRVMPVDLDFPHTLTRSVTINLPKGYKVMNPEALLVNSDYLDANMRPVIGFKTDYTIIPDKKNGDKLLINVNEYYSQIHFPVNEYEQFRKVFNAAADFNKVVLVLEKKKGV